MVGAAKTLSNTQTLMIIYFIKKKKWNLCYGYPHGIKKDNIRQTLVCTSNAGQISVLHLQPLCSYNVQNLRSRTVARLWCWQQAWHWWCSKAAERKQSSTLLLWQKLFVKNWSRCMLIPPTKPKCFPYPYYQLIFRGPPLRIDQGNLNANYR